MSEATKKSWWPGLVTWLVIGGLVLVNVFIWYEVNRITLHHILYRLDFRHWPVNLGMVFWLLFVWLVMDLAIFREQRTVSTQTTSASQKFRSVAIVIKFFIFVSVPCLLLTSFFTWREMWRWIYFSILMPFYFEPMTMFFYDATMTKRLAVPPLTAVVAIGFLLYLNHISKKRDQS